MSHYKGLVTILFLGKAFFLKAMIFRNDCIAPKLLLNLKNLTRGKCYLGLSEQYRTKKLQKTSLHCSKIAMIYVLCFK